MVRLEFHIPDYARGLAPGPGGGLERRISLALAGAHARAVEGEAKRRAPVRSGGLRDSIRAYLAGAGRGVLEASAPHAKYLHRGTGIYGPAGRPIVIEPRGKKALHWPGAAHPVRVVRQRGIKPRDFLRHAVRMYFPALRTFAASLRMELIAIFLRNQIALRKANDYRQAENKERKRNNQEELLYGTLGKYFHCKADCEAAHLGYLAETVLASYAKEEFDLIIDNLRRAIYNWYYAVDDTHDKKYYHPPKDSIEDMGANRKGLGSGVMVPSTPCSEPCSGYRPGWLPKDSRQGGRYEGF